MAGPVLNVRLFAKSKNASTKSYTLPALFMMMGSPTLERAVGSNDALVLDKRIADELSIKDGDTIDFELCELGQEISYPVKVLEHLSAGDFLMHAAFRIESLDIECSTDLEGTHLRSFVTGARITLPEQSVFSGMKALQVQGTCTLNFDGGSRNNPKGPAGWGYVIVDEAGEWLVKAYGHKSGEHTGNFMEYQGLLEGMIWANRLDPRHIKVRGDSELIMKQITGQYKVNEPNLSECRDSFQSIVDKNSRKGTSVSTLWIPREQNCEADRLANLAMDRMESKIVVNWYNIDKFVAGPIWKKKRAS